MLCTDGNKALACSQANGFTSAAGDGADAHLVTAASSSAARTVKCYFLPTMKPAFLF